MPARICKLQCDCGNVVEYMNRMHPAYYIQHMVKTTGWHFLYKIDGEVLWLCPLCAPKAAKAARNLVAVLGTGLVQLGHISELDDGKSFV